MFTAFAIYLFSRQVVQFGRQTQPMTWPGRVRKLPDCPILDLQGDTTSTRELGFQGRRFTDIHDWEVVQTLGPESDAESFKAKI